MKTNEKIQAAFFEAVGKPEKATEETVAQACAAVQKKATDFFGPGIYVTGRLNFDMQGISFRYKRPALRQRLEVFVPVPVDNPEEAQKSSGHATRSSDTSKTEPVLPGATQDRLLLLESTLSTLNANDYTSDGRPHVDAVNRALEPDESPFTATERDTLWAERSGE